jgi:MbtH protein
MDNSRDEYLVLVNEDERYSLWPAFKEIPEGWRQVQAGNKQVCLAFVKETWTDMRPLSVRRQAAKAALPNG